MGNWIDLKNTSLEERGTVTHITHKRGKTTHHAGWLLPWQWTEHYVSSTVHTDSHNNWMSLYDILETTSNNRLVQPITDAVKLVMSVAFIM